MCGAGAPHVVVEVRCDAALHQDTHTVIYCEVAGGDGELYRSAALATHSSAGPENRRRRVDAISMIMFARSPF